MLEASITFGVIIFVGMALLFSALPRWLRFFMLRHDLFTVFTVTAVTLWIHWGTMTGLMSATLAGLMTSLACYAGKAYWRIT
jgi:hypothetical protein